MTFSVPHVPVVVDASAAVEFLDGNPEWLAAFDRWAADDRMLLAPATFYAEVANAHLRGRKAPARAVTARIKGVLATGIETADRGLPGLLEAIELGAAHGLTVYDALYLQLAIDVDGELATLDADLRRAATAENVPLIA